jgi:hypothetical protein
MYARENARERAGIAADCICHHRQAEDRKAGGIAIGVDDRAVGLRPEPLDDVLEHRPSTDGNQRFVAASHAAGESSGQNNANDWTDAIGGCRYQCSRSDTFLKP